MELGNKVRDSERENHQHGVSVGARHTVYLTPTSQSEETKNTISTYHSPAGTPQSQTTITKEIRASFSRVSWLLTRTRKPNCLHSHHPNHTSTAEPRSPLFGFGLISDTDISAGRRRPCSTNEIVLTRTCVDDVGCTDDGGPLQIARVCTFETPRATRMRISVGAMPCVILRDNWFMTNSQPPMGEEYARRFAQQSLRRCPARGAGWRRG
jgi:hypothetical protein